MTKFVTNSKISTKSSHNTIIFVTYQIELNPGLKQPVRFLQTIILFTDFSNYQINSKEIDKLCTIYYFRREIVFGLIII